MNIEIMVFSWETKVISTLLLKNEVNKTILRIVQKTVIASFAVHMLSPKIFLANMFRIKNQVINFKLLIKLII